MLGKVLFFVLGGRNFVVFSVWNVVFFLDFFVR